MPKDYLSAKSGLYPKVMCRSAISYSEMEFNDGFKKSDFSIPHQVLTDDLALVVVYDSPHSTEVVNAEDYARWELGFEEVLKSSIEQFEDCVVVFKPAEGHVYVSEMNDSYDATRLILTAAIRELKLPGLPIAFAPMRDKLLITGSEDPEGILRVLSMAEEAADGPYPISGSAFRLEGDEWKAWMPSPENESYNHFKLLNLRSRAG